MEAWRRSLIFDPLPPLITAENEAIRYYARRDLLGEAVPSISVSLELNEVRRLLRNRRITLLAVPRRSPYLPALADSYDQLETYRIVGELVEKFGMTRDHSAMRQAAEYLFSHQTNEGDFRGIYGTQYSPNYSAAIMELLIKAGYSRDERIAQGFQWLLDIRQRDGDGRSAAHHRREA